jgi:hypothetical protein
MYVPFHSAPPNEFANDVFVFYFQGAMRYRYGLLDCDANATTASSLHIKHHLSASL